MRKKERKKENKKEEAKKHTHLERKTGIAMQI